MATKSLKGSRFIAYGEKEDAMLRFCGSQNFNLTINAEVKKATKAPTSNWASNYYGELSYGLTASGLCRLNDKLTHRDMLDKMVNQEPMLWVGRDLDNHDEFYSGYLIITSLSLDKNMKTIQTYSLTCVGDGELITINPYEIRMIQTRIQNGQTGVLGSMTNDQYKIITQYITGGLPPLID